MSFRSWPGACEEGKRIRLFYRLVLSACAAKVALQGKEVPFMLLLEGAAGRRGHQRCVIAAGSTSIAQWALSIACQLGIISM